MSSSILFRKYETLFGSLNTIIKISEGRIIQEDTDSLFIQNTNFFVKAYLINICTYLEAFLQDIAHEHVEFLKEKLKTASIPKNVILWRVRKDLKEKELGYSDFNLDLTKREISDELSGSPYKTIKLFRYIGIDLSKEDNFTLNKDFINTIVTKRNNIVHHNDNAMDISFSDLITYSNSVLLYMQAIDRAVTTQGGKRIT